MSPTPFLKMAVTGHSEAAQLGRKALPTSDTPEPISFAASGAGTSMRLTFGVRLRASASPDKFDERLCASCIFM